MADIKAIAEELVNLTVKEVNELATVLKDEYGIEPAAAAVAVAAGPAAGGAAAAEEKSTFDVVLAEVGGAKLQVVKAVKEACGLGLKEAKDLVDGAPSTIKEGVAKDEAENLKMRDAVDKSVYDAGDDLRDSRYNGSNDLGQRLDERHQQVDARLDDLRNGVQNGCDNAFDDLYIITFHFFPAVDFGSVHFHAFGCLNQRAAEGQRFALSGVELLESFCA